MTQHSLPTKLCMALVAVASILASGCCSGNPVCGVFRWGPGHKNPCQSPHCPTWSDCYGYHSTCWDRWPDECQSCPPPVDPAMIHAAPAPESIIKPSLPAHGAPTVIDSEEAPSEEMPNPGEPNPGVLEEPAPEEGETIPPESDEEPTATYLRPVKAKASYYRSAKDRPREQAHVAYLLPTPDVEAPANTVRATPVRASVSDEAEELPKPVFPKTRLVR